MGWKVKRRERYALIEVDDANPLVHRGTFHIGPRYVRHHASKEFVEHAYVENPDFASERNCRVFAQSSNIAVEVYDFYNKLFDPDYENVSVHDERFEVQYLFKEKPKEKWRSVDYYNPRIEIIPLDDGVDIKKTFDTDYGAESLEITYTVRTGARLKHTIVFTNKTAEQRAFRVVMKLAGITSDKVKHGQVEEQITEEKHTVAPVMFFGEDNQHLKLSEYLWSLGVTDEETLEWSPTTLKDIVLDIHAQGCKADIIIGNYTLAENDSLLIDPDSDTWRVGSSSYDCLRRKPASNYWSTTHGSCAAGTHSATKYSFGSGMRFINIGIPQYNPIISAYIQFTADDNRSLTPVNTRVSGEDVGSASAFSSEANFDGRVRTSAVVDWDGIPAWSTNEKSADTTSPNIKTIIQEIVNRGDWNSGNHLVIFWDDFDQRSPLTGLYDRAAYSYDGSTTKCAELTVTWTVVVVAIELFQEEGTDFRETKFGATWGYS